MQQFIDLIEVIINWIIVQESADLVIIGLLSFLSLGLLDKIWEHLMIMVAAIFIGGLLLIVMVAWINTSWPVFILILIVICVILKIMEWYSKE